jgi:hypothetical protein
MAQINMNDIRKAIQDAINNPNTPHNKDKIRQLKRQLRKIKLEIRLNDGNREVKSEP